MSLLVRLCLYLEFVPEDMRADSLRGRWAAIARFYTVMTLPYSTLESWYEYEYLLAILGRSWLTVGDDTVLLARKLSEEMYL